MVGHPKSSFKWKDHANNLKSELSYMIAKGKYVDVKLVAEDGQFLHVHRLILHSSSKYFEVIYYLKLFYNLVSDNFYFLF